VTTKWEKLKITDQLVRDELRRPAPGDYNDGDSNDDYKIEIGGNFSYDLAQKMGTGLNSNSQDTLPSVDDIAEMGENET
jgi:hypothetical protein